MDIEPSLYNSSSMLLCSKCNQIPLYQLISPYQLSFNCDCSHKEIIQLENAFNSFSKYCDRKFYLPQMCQQHNKKVYCYCESCRCTLCYQCLSFHLSHSVIKFKSLKSKINNRNLLKELNEAKIHIQQEHNQIKNEIIQELRNKIKKVEYAFKRSEERNERIYRYISMIINTHESNKNIPNYHIVKNLIDNTNYSTISFNQTVNTNELSLENKVKACIDYLNTNHIIKFPNMNLTHSIYSNENFTCLLLLSDNTVACGTQSGLILIYNKTTLIDTLKGHTSKVNHISQLNDGRLISSSCDSTIKIWQKNFYQYKCEATLCGHSCSVSKTIQIDDNTIASCSYDTTIKIWSLTDSFKCISTLKGHKREVTSLLLLNDGRLVSNSIDSSNTLLFWDLSTGTFTEHKIKGLGISGERNKMYQIDNEHIILDNTNEKGCYLKDMIYVININTYQIENFIMIDNEYIKTFFVKGEMLYIGCDKGKLYKYNMKKNEYMKIIAHKGFISDIVVDSKDNVFTCSNKGELKIWSN